MGSTFTKEIASTAPISDNVTSEFHSDDQVEVLVETRGNKRSLQAESDPNENTNNRSNYDRADENDTDLMLNNNNNNSLESVNEENRKVPSWWYENLILIKIVLMVLDILSDVWTAYHNLSLGRIWLGLANCFFIILPAISHWTPAH